MTGSIRISGHYVQILGVDIQHSDIGSGASVALRLPGDQAVIACEALLTN